MAIYSGFSHRKWWFSTAMLNYQRVTVLGNPSYKENSLIKATSDPRFESLGHLRGLDHHFHSWISLKQQILGLTSSSITTNTRSLCHHLDIIQWTSWNHSGTLWTKQISKNCATPAWRCQEFPSLAPTVIPKKSEMPGSTTFWWNNNNLVGGFKPSEKYQSIGWWFPIYGKIKFVFQSPPTSNSLTWIVGPSDWRW